MAEQKQSQNNSDTKKTLQNITLNIIIFLLVASIIYLVFSIFLKITDKEKPDGEVKNENAPSEIIQLEVKNGCGTSGVADRFTDYLRLNNVDVVSIGNYILNEKPFFNVNETLVIDRTGNMANAKKIAELLGVKKKNILQQINKDYFLDVSVIIGKDYIKLLPFK